MTPADYEEILARLAAMRAGRREPEPPPAAPAAAAPVAAAPVAAGAGAAVPRPGPSQDVGERARLWGKEASGSEYSDHDLRASGARPRFCVSAGAAMRRLSGIL